MKVDMISCAPYENESYCEESGENDSHGSAAVNVAEFADPLREYGSENSRRRSPDEHGNARFSARNDERDCHTRQYGVTNRVTHHTHFPENKEASWQGTCDCAEHTDDHNPGICGSPVHASAGGSG